MVQRLVHGVWHAWQQKTTARATRCLGEGKERNMKPAMRNKVVTLPNIYIYYTYNVMCVCIHMYIYIHLHVHTVYMHINMHVWARSLILIYIYIYHYISPNYHISGFMCVQPLFLFFVVQNRLNHRPCHQRIGHIGTWPSFDTSEIPGLGQCC